MACIHSQLTSCLAESYNLGGTKFVVTKPFTLDHHLSFPAFFFSRKDNNLVGTADH